MPGVVTGRDHGLHRAGGEAGFLHGQPRYARCTLVLVIGDGC
ncbi:hypothetical protein ABZ297_00245 [Nonomuraea sp. NPDC005983]